MKPPKGLNDLSDTLAIGFHSNDHHGGEILTLSSEDRYNGVKKNASIYKSSLKKRVWRKKMRNTVWTKYIGFFVALFLLFAFSSVTIAQGKGKGKSKSKNKTSNSKSGKSDKANKDKSSKNHGDNKSGGKDKAKTSRRFNGLAKKIGMSPERAQNWYERERELNSDLTYGQFVAANMIARKHRSRHPRLKTESILGRMRDGDSLGQAVRDLGLSKSDYKKEKKRIKKEFDASDNDDEEDDRFDFKIHW